MITIEKKSLKVGEYVDTKHVDEVIRTYKQERWIHNSKRIGKEDSLSGWYSVEELEEFIETIKDHGADGIADGESGRQRRSQRHQFASRAGPFRALNFRLNFKRAYDT